MSNESCILVPHAESASLEIFSTLVRNRRAMPMSYPVCSMLIKPSENVTGTSHTLKPLNHWDCIQSVDWKVKGLVHYRYVYLASTFPMGTTASGPTNSTESVAKEKSGENVVQLSNGGSGSNETVVN
jgi:hypothetical protein